jgi:CRISPR-associated protein Csc1
MASVIDLNSNGVRLFACRFYNHDYLWFSSFEISKQSVTIPILHNYALCYSLAERSYGISFNSTPQYESDLAQMPLYATPALGRNMRQIRITFNAINSLSLRTDDKPNDINSPDIGYRVYLAPVFRNDATERAGSGFSGYLFTFDGSLPKGMVRLGKKGTPIRVEYSEIKTAKAFFKTDLICPSHPVNPLDVSGIVESYDPISLPPHLLLRIANIRDDWFVTEAGHTIHVPKRVLERIQK